MWSRCSSPGRSLALDTLSIQKYSSVKKTCVTLSHIFDRIINHDELWNATSHFSTFSLHFLFHSCSPHQYISPCETEQDPNGNSHIFFACIFTVYCNVKKIQDLMQSVHIWFIHSPLFFLHTNVVQEYDMNG
jgi:hypothetical protein